VPPNLRLLMYFNPLYYLVVLYQDVLMLHQLPTTRFMSFTVFLCLGMFLVGYTIFMRLKPVFSDVL
jgi:lipopolysaccharide transport system permease protein